MSDNEFNPAGWTQASTPTSQTPASESTLTPLPPSLVKAGFSESSEGVHFKPYRHWQDLVRMIRFPILISLFSFTSPHFHPRISVFTIYGVLATIGYFGARPHTRISENARTVVNSKTGTEVKTPLTSMHLVPSLFGSTIIVVLQNDSQKVLLRARDIEPVDRSALRELLKRHNRCEVSLCDKRSVEASKSTLSRVSVLSRVLLICILFLGASGGFKRGNLPQRRTRININDPYFQPQLPQQKQWPTIETPPAAPDSLDPVT
jgi:hypothetical protein